MQNKTNKIEKIDPAFAVSCRFAVGLIELLSSDDIGYKDDPTGYGGTTKDRDEVSVKIDGKEYKRNKLIPLLSPNKEKPESSANQASVSPIVAEAGLGWIQKMQSFPVIMKRFHEVVKGQLFKADDWQLDPTSYEMSDSYPFNITGFKINIAGATHGKIQFIRDESEQLTYTLKDFEQNDNEGDSDDYYQSDGVNDLTDLLNGAVRGLSYHIKATDIIKDKLKQDIENLFYTSLADNINSSTESDPGGVQKLFIIMRRLKEQGISLDKNQEYFLDDNKDKLYELFDATKDIFLVNSCIKNSDTDQIKLFIITGRLDGQGISLNSNQEAFLDQNQDKLYELYAVTGNIFLIQHCIEIPSLMDEIIEKSTKEIITKTKNRIGWTIGTTRTLTRKQLSVARGNGASEDNTIVDEVYAANNLTDIFLAKMAPLVQPDMQFDFEVKFTGSDLDLKSQKKLYELFSATKNIHLVMACLAHPEIMQGIIELHTDQDSKKLKRRESATKIEQGVLGHTGTEKALDNIREAYAADLIDELTRKLNSDSRSNTPSTSGYSSADSEGTPNSNEGSGNDSPTPGSDDPSPPPGNDITPQSKNSSAFFQPVPTPTPAQQAPAPAQQAPAPVGRPGPS